MQASGLVPIVEPEVLLDGEHDIDRTFEVAQEVWAQTFKYLADQKVCVCGVAVCSTLCLHAQSPGAAIVQCRGCQPLHAGRRAVDILSILELRLRTCAAQASSCPSRHTVRWRRCTWPPPSALEAEV